MAYVGVLGSVAPLELRGNPLVQGMVRVGVVRLREDLEVHCGRTFCWMQEGKGYRRALVRVIAAAAADHLPARAVVLVGGKHELLVFGSELELWVPPRGRPSAVGRARLRVLVGEPLR